MFIFSLIMDGLSFKPINRFVLTSKTVQFFLLTHTFLMVKYFYQNTGKIIQKTEILQKFVKKRHR